MSIHLSTQSRQDQPGPRRNMVWSTKSPLNFFMASTTSFTWYSPTGLLMRATSLSVGASSFRMGLSTFLRASKIPGCPQRVAFVSTDTFADG